MALKRTVGITAVERDVDETLSTMVLMTVFWTVVYAVEVTGVTIVIVETTLGIMLVAR